jgi:hypothetical protein
LGTLLGAAAVGLGAALADEFASPYLDSWSAGELGWRFAALGGALPALTGVVIGALAAVAGAQPGSLRDFAAWAAGGLYLGLFTGPVGAVSGVAVGLLIGRQMARIGWRLARRTGAVLGAALAWAAAASLAGALTGDRAAHLAVPGTETIGAALGLTTQIVAGGLLIAAFRRPLTRLIRRLR